MNALLLLFFRTLVQLTDLLKEAQQVFSGDNKVFAFGWRLAQLPLKLSYLCFIGSGKFVILFRCNQPLVG